MRGTVPTTQVRITPTTSLGNGVQPHEHVTVNTSSYLKRSHDPQKLPPSSTHDKVKDIPGESYSLPTAFKSSQHPSAPPAAAAAGTTPTNPTSGLPGNQTTEHGPQQVASKWAYKLQTSPDGTARTVYLPVSHFQTFQDIQREPAKGTPRVEVSLGREVSL